MLTGALSMVRLRTGRPGLCRRPRRRRRTNSAPWSGSSSTAGWRTSSTAPPDEVRTGLDDLQKRTGADELMITANAHGGEARLRSYELIADAYDLPGGLVHS